MNSVAESFANIAEVFARDGYYVARDVYPENMLRQLEEDFDRNGAAWVKSGGGGCRPPVVPDCKLPSPATPCDWSISGGAPCWRGTT